MPLSLPIVCVVTRARGAAGSTERSAWLDRLRETAAAGASMIQVRDRLLDDRALLEFLRDLRRTVAGTGCAVLVNDRIDLALAAGIDGVHLKSHSVLPADVRPIVPPGFLIGRSVHAIDEARRIEAAGGCDYLLFGTVFPSRSKPDEHPIAGSDALREVCGAVHLPVIAIGGVTPQRAGEVMAAGAAGAAAISWFADAKEVRDAVIALRHALTPNRGNV
jgi:thiamine-phosphate diphosphorylase